jgi:hypothetical protein
LKRISIKMGDDALKVITVRYAIEGSLLGVTAVGPWHARLHAVDGPSSKEPLDLFQKGTICAGQLDAEVQAQLAARPAIRERGLAIGESGHLPRIESRARFT